MIDEYNAILASPERQRAIVSEELAEIVDKFGDDRRTKIVPLRRRHVDGGPHPRGGRGRHDHPRRLRQAHPGRPLPLAAARRQGRARARSCAATTSSSTSSPRPPTTGCCSSPTWAGSTGPRPTSCPRAAATPRASTSPTCWRSSRASRSPRCSTCATTQPTPYLRAGHPRGLVKKTRLAEYDSNRSGGLIAVNLREGDELVGAGLASAAGRPAAGLAQGPVGALHTPPTRRCGRWAGPPPASPA